MDRHLALLGLKVRDKVTKFEGIVTTIGFDLYGCIQALINPGMGPKGELRDQHWFDISRIKILDDSSIMDQPNYQYGFVSDGKKGAAEKPEFQTIPINKS